MNSSATRLVLLPGLGADARMLYPQREAFPGVITPPWLDPEPRETLPHYAQRMAAAVPPPSDGPVILGGVSLGGMLALEMAAHCDADAVILIASCRGPAAISPLMTVSEAASRPLPSPVVARMLRFGPFFVGRGGSITTSDRRLLGTMVRQVRVPFLRWASRAIIEWEGASPSVPVRHIHGDRDWVIPVGRVEPETIVRGGAHVLNLSHPREVNEFVGRCVDAAAA